MSKSMMKRLNVQYGRPMMSGMDAAHPTERSEGHGTMKTRQYSSRPVAISKIIEKVIDKPNLIRYNGRIN